MTAPFPCTRRAREFSPAARPPQRLQPCRCRTTHRRLRVHRRLQPAALRGLLKLSNFVELAGTTTSSTEWTATSTGTTRRSSTRASGLLRELPRPHRRVPGIRGYGHARRARRRWRSSTARQAVRLKTPPSITRGEPLGSSLHPGHLVRLRQGHLDVGVRFEHQEVKPDSRRSTASATRTPLRRSS